MFILIIYDMFIFIGYWYCLDLELGKDIGLYFIDEILDVLYVDRY